MSYIRSRENELTGYQVAAPYISEIDLQCDFVMVYGLDNNLNERIKGYKEQGYIVHLMTGVAWGHYQDYLNGNFDGRKHWDEAQKQRNGQNIEHCTPEIPYMVPTISFSEYLTELIKPAIDAGIEAIHLEEPEYWSFGGHADAFKREYEFYYKKPWQYVESSVDSIYKSSKVMAYIYTRAVDRICSSLKEYAKVKYNKDIRFYIATHSLISYTQIQMVSPESLLIDIPSIDGYIAQIWTGTSRVPNEYLGITKERTFEVGFMEYGIMQELVKGTDKKMWFLHDPVEDNPIYDWDDYEYNYVKTVVASLFHPKVSNYEICPWPDRVYAGKYPQNHPTVKEQFIPPHYATKLSNMIQMLGDMEQQDCKFISNEIEVGVLIGDSAMYQRCLPDEYMTDPESINIVGHKFSDFFGITMPLIKYGLPVRPVQLDNIRKIPGYLEDYKVLLLSYEFFKPESPDINVSIANWISEGGALIYIGDGSDQFHNVSHWWNKNDKYKNPAQHLFEIIGLTKNPATGLHKVKNGNIYVLCKRPAVLTHSIEGAELVRKAVQEAFDTKGYVWSRVNNFILQRGKYLVVACMNESVSDKPVVIEGLFADMTDPLLRITNTITVMPDENNIFYDLNKIKDKEYEIVGSSLRIDEFSCNGHAASVKCRGPKPLDCVMRLKLPFVPKQITVKGGNIVLTPEFEWDEMSSTVLISFQNIGGWLDINMYS